jgi:CheY-like chemotaxis protein
MNRSYSPVALIVDDDEAVVRRISRNFLRETSMGVLQAHTLGQAAELIEDHNIRIDALVTDLNFSGDTRDESRDLHEGLELIQFIEKNRPEVPSVVVSVEGDEASKHTRAKEMGIHVRKWYQKLGPMTGPLTPWATVERECLANALKKDRDFRARLKELGIEVRDLLSDEAIAEKVRSVVKFPRLTYLTDVGNDFEVVTPIEVICSRENKQRYSASAIQIGMATCGEGENLDEAVKDLAVMLAAEAKLFQDEAHEPRGFAAIVKKNLGLFLKAKAKEKKNETAV